MHKRLGEREHARRHRGGEEQGLEALLLRVDLTQAGPGSLEDKVDVIHKAVGEHLVGFVKHRHLDVGQVERPALHQVHHPARCANHHVRPVSQLLDCMRMRVRVGQRV